VSVVLTAEQASPAPRGQAGHGGHAHHAHGKPQGGQPQGGPAAKPVVPGVRAIVAVASGKGGVGKSTTAVNLALALASRKLRVGLLDADIYGPSLPRMMKVGGRPDSKDGKTLEPKLSYGI